MPDTDWVSVFTRASELIDTSVIYHGALLADSAPCFCLWTATAQAYSDEVGDDIDEDDASLVFAARVLRKATGMAPDSANLFPVFKWNDTHSDAEIRAAAARAIDAAREFIH